MHHINALLTSAFRTATILCLFVGVAIVLTPGEDGERRLVGTLLLVFGALGVLVWCYGSWRSRPERFFNKPVSKLISADLLPKRKVLAASLKSVTASHLIYATTAKRSDFPQTGIQFADSVILERMQAWKRKPKAPLSDAQLAELYAIRKILCGSKEEADLLLGLLSHPEPIRQLRKGREQQDATYQQEQASTKAYRDACMYWEHHGNIDRYHEGNDLVGFLQDMPLRDVDLWHDIATGAEVGWTPDDDALIWISKQPECDKATAATIVATLVDRDTLLSDVKRGTLKRADLVEEIIRKWNDGFYVSQRFGTDHGVTEAEFDTLNAKVAEYLGQPAWPKPIGMFQKFEGRETEATYYFRHGMGLMTKPPQLSDFQMSA